MRPLLSLGFLLASILLPHAAVSAALPSAPFGVGLNGQPLTSLTLPGTRAVVLLFVASDCPISNRYLPEIERLAQQYAARQVRFFLVYPNPGETSAGLRAHRAAYGPASPNAQTTQTGQTVTTLLDPDQSLVKLAHARVTPEAAIFFAQPTGLRRAYLGRLDDRYLSFGKQRPKATKNDLEDALTALLAGDPIHAPTAPPVGCAIIPLP